MTRFEATTALAIVALVGTASSPAFGQFIKFDNGTKEVATQTKGPNDKPARAPRAPVAPKSDEPVEPTFVATGEFSTSVEKARESAIQSAVERLRDYLSAQDPPIHQMPPHATEFVRKRLLDKQEKVVEEAG